MPSRATMNPAETAKKKSETTTKMTSFIGFTDVELGKFPYQFVRTVPA
jgi:hypothetical protein